VGFVRRVFPGSRGRRPQGWYDLPRSGWFEIDVVEDYRASLAFLFPSTGKGEEPAIYDDVAVTLRRDPRNRHDRNAVEVRRRDRVIGHIPRDKAPAWSAYLAKLEAAGYRARAAARVRAGWSVYWIDLLADPDCDYLLPDEQAALDAEQQREDAGRAAAEAQRTLERERKTALRAALRQQREAVKALEAERRASGQCLLCGRPLGETSSARRRLVRCADCRKGDGRKYASSACPYCDGAFDPLPTATGTCPTCGEQVHVQVGPDGFTYLLQTRDLPVLEQAWAELGGTRADRH
jgi:ssDNA-binding Zn-finger/Zn-ribbon topoisomerase 1